MQVIYFYQCGHGRLHPTVRAACDEAVQRTVACRDYLAAALEQRGRWVQCFDRRFWFFVAEPRVGPSNLYRYEVAK